MRSLFFAWLCMGCNSEPLPVASQSSALGCQAAIRGDISADLADDWPPIATLRPGSIELSCRGAARPNVSPDFMAPDFSLFIPRGAASFTSAQATFNIDLPPTPSKSFPSEWYRGSCSGTIITAPQQIGDRARGSFSCSALSGIVDTPPSHFVTVSDGSFDLPVQMPPPE
jgi:hypothetical protein